MCSSDGSRISADTWKKATAVEFATDWAGTDTGLKTAVKFAWSKDALYTQWELSGTGFNVDTTKPIETERERLYEEDCVEMMFTPDPANTDHYYEVELGPLGHFFDLEVHRGVKLDVKKAIAWSSKPAITPHPDQAGHFSFLEANFRAPEIVTALKAGAVLPLALYRMEGKSPRKYLAWSPTKTPHPDFHVPAAFGRLVIDP